MVQDNNNYLINSMCCGSEPAQHVGSAYRPDIDGLRAFAVLAVIAYHAFPHWVKGGFVGVDIFFVISGFLISGVILTDLSKGTFSFVNFYARRIRRIFPALFVVLLAALVFGWFALFTDEYKALGKHTAGGAFFVSNFFFWREAGYWDVSAEVKPLLHLWSLGIEEQFYIILPFLLYFSWRKQWRILTVVLFLLVISFACNIHWYKKDPVMDFYAPYTRFWELLTGVGVSILTIRPLPWLSALWVKADRLCTALLFENPQENEGRGISNSLAFLGIVLLLISVFSTRSAQYFPGYRALLPVLGTVFILSAGKNAWINRIFLSNKLTVGIGIISYPLYLWHWPLLSYARIIDGATPDRFVRLGMVVLSFVLAYLTYCLIERPIRFGKRAKTAKIMTLMALMTLIGFAGWYVYWNDGLLKRANMKQYEKVMGELKISPNINDAGRAYASTIPDKVIQSVDSDWAQSYLLYTDVGKNETIAIIGDSHAKAAYYGIAKINSEYGVNTVLLARSGLLSPILIGLEGYIKEYDQSEIKKHTTAVINTLVNKKDIKKVFIFSFYEYYLTGWSPVEISEAAYRSALQLTVDTLRHAGKEVFVVADNPILRPYHMSVFIGRPFSTPPPPFIKALYWNNKKNIWLCSII
jgi:peptidoglycan/LPS O-acetylase OafA/YrhL